MLFCFHFLCFIFASCSEWWFVKQQKELATRGRFYQSGCTSRQNLSQAKKGMFMVSSSFGNCEKLLLSIDCRPTDNRQVIDSHHFCCMRYLERWSMKHVGSPRNALNFFGTKTYRQITDCQPSDNRPLVGQQVFSGIFSPRFLKFPWQVKI